MIASEFYKEVEHAYLIKDTWHYPGGHPDDLPEYLRQFCQRLNIRPALLFVRSHKEEYVMLRAAFLKFIPDSYTYSDVGRFFNYHPSSVRHWKKVHKDLLPKYRYQVILNKLDIKQ